MAAKTTSEVPVSQGREKPCINATYNSNLALDQEKSIRHRSVGAVEPMGAPPGNDNFSCCLNSLPVFWLNPMSALETSFKEDGISNHWVNEKCKQ
ncbi:hypothetical protein [Geomonas oryzae]|uniref:hypothetical protein n=1 Tax=Geomonas oryzae TaxID=2364273 RepID=UPI0013A5D9B5|nr:hypothetical protein [Geomonas oryzae]